MSTIGRPVLNCGAATTVGDVIECSGIAHLQLFARVTSSAAALIGNVEFASTPDGQGNLATTAAAPLIATPNNVFAMTISPDASITLDAAAAQMKFATTPAGTYLFAIRISNPPQYVVPRFTYTSGGGTVSVQVFAYGFSIKT